MTLKLTLYSRKDCCLCEAMKAVIGEVARQMPLELEEIDVDGAADLRQKFGDEVPVLYVNGRKAFKYRITARELTKRLGKETRPSSFWLSRKSFGNR
ncbi:MAG: glutaredoxin family protein [Chloroflexota bacterium]